MTYWEMSWQDQMKAISECRARLNIGSGNIGKKFKNPLIQATNYLPVWWLEQLFVLEWEHESPDSANQ